MRAFVQVWVNCGDNCRGVANPSVELTGDRSGRLQIDATSLGEKLAEVGWKKKNVTTPGFAGGVTWMCPGCVAGGRHE